MYYLDEMTYNKIAEIGGCTKRAIKFSVDTARKNLQAELKNLYRKYGTRSTISANAWKTKESS